MKGATRLAHPPSRPILKLASEDDRRILKARFLSSRSYGIVVAQRLFRSDNDSIETFCRAADVASSVVIFHFEVRGKFGHLVTLHRLKVMLCPATGPMLTRRCCRSNRA